MCLTWGGQSRFEYTGTVGTGTDIAYGAHSRWRVRVSGAKYRELRKHFLGRTVSVGPSRTAPTPHSLGEWLKQRRTATAIASYVAPILVREGYAVRVGGNKLRVIR